MANASLKKNFKDGDKLFAAQLNNNFGTIEAALAAMNKIVWQDDETGTGISAYKGDTVAIDDRELMDGQLLYNTETGETYIDTYINDVLTRINTGSGNVVAIQEDEPTNDAVKLWIEKDTLDTLDSEITNTSSNSTGIGYSAAYMNDYLGELLWENESPTSDFASQNVSIDLSNYEYINIICSSGSFGCEVPTSGQSGLNIYKFQDSNGNWSGSWFLDVRGAFVSNSGVTFQDNRGQGTNVSNQYSIRNNQNKPLKIIGYKKVYRR